MTVAVLKEELKKRGLDATGLKAALVARLEEAMAGEDDGAAAEAAAPEEEEAKEEPKEEAGEEEDVRAKAEEMAEKAMAEHAASEKKRERSPEQDDAPPEAKSAKSDGEHAAAPSSAQGGLTKDGQNLATYEMPDGQVRKDVPTQGNEGRIIGRGGSKIRELQDMFRTRITMNRPAGLAEVVGMLDHVNDCCDEITRIVEDGNVREAAERAGQPVPGGAYSSYGGGGYGGGGGGFGGGGGGFGGGGFGGGGGGGGGGPFSGHMERVPCEGQEGRIIGRGGENIRRVESQTGTRIKMNRVDNVAEVYGTPAQCTEAVRMIQEYIHTAPNRGGGGFGGGGFGQQGGYGGGDQQQSFGQQAGYGGGYQQQAGYGQPAYGAPAGGAPLPHGWEEVNPGNGGPVYYWDTVSNTTTYTRPT